MLHLKNVKKDYVTASETVHALKGVTISFRDKEFVSILGPSGCGKTTLLNLIGGLDHYTSGNLIINNKSTATFRDRDWDVYRNHRVGFIFQSYNLIPHQSVLGNVELALTIAGIGKRERVERAKKALDRVGLEGQYYTKPNQLSGGQCQRVAIARALVNDPEILLADEPTGALDTVTSVQIMDLIKEISKERLVIMVTHNPDLAMKYSTRIVGLRDGYVVQDTNPVSEEELKPETRRLTAKERRQARREARAKKKERAKMSFFTAFRLSAKNLISKKGRTSMVGLAGSIGIIGIATVLAFSAGIKGYVASMQDDMLSGNPITIGETAYDLEALTGMLTAEGEEIKSEAGKVFINSLIKYIAKTQKDTESTIIKNDITKEYVDYITSMPEEYYSAMLLGYGLDLTNSIYTDFYNKRTEPSEKMSVHALTSMYTAILEETDFSEYASYITQIVPSFEQAPNNEEYIRHQYDVIGEIADEYDEVMLVLDKDERLSDLLLARLGYYSAEEFIGMINDVTGSEDFQKAEHPEYFTYEQLLEKTFTWYPNDDIFTAATSQFALGPFTYAPNASDISTDNAVELKVVGILYTNASTTYGCLSSGIYYTEELTKHVLATNAESEIVKYVNEKGSIVSMNSNGFDVGISYKFNYTYAGEVKTGTAYLGEGLGLTDMVSGIVGSMSGSGSSGGSSKSSSSGATDSGTGNLGGFGGTTGGATGGTGNLGGLGGTTGGTGLGGTTGGTGLGGMTGGTTGGSGAMGGMSSIDLVGMRTLTARHLGGVSVANSISIYPLSFDSKDLVTDYLDLWNADGDVTVNGEVISASDRNDIKYMDTLELVINLINGMIDVVSYALIAFTSVSLVVSTVMIGIITYVSVVERIKEIGVIRSLGGRKKDVSRLFTAETFILGLMSGLIGIGATYLISAIVSAIVYNLAGIPNIASLPTSQAILMVALSVVLTLISGVMPAKSAAKKDPVVALRTE